MSNSIKLDAAEHIAFQRQLEQLEAKAFEVKYAALKARQLCPVIPVDPAAETYTYRMSDSVGTAKRVADYAKDFPTVGLKDTETSQRLQSYGDGFLYSIQEIRAAQKAGVDLDGRKMRAARAALDQQLDTIASTGDSVASLKGLTNLANTLDVDPDAGASTSKLWSTKTADEILKDMSDLLAKAPTSTLEVERATRVLLPTAQFELIKRLRMPNTERTVWAFVQENYPGVEVMSWERLAGAGASSTDLAIAYEPNPDKLGLLMAVDFEMAAPQQEGFAFKVPCHMRTGGVIAYYPKSITYMDGI